MTTTDQVGQGTSHVTDTTTQAAGEVAGTATQAAGEVAGTAKQQMGMVADEAVGQAQQLMGQAQQELTQQASEQTQRLGANLRQAAQHLSTMADTGEQGSPAQAAVRRLAEQGERVAGYLEAKQPGAMVADLQGLGRRRPGAFLLGAALAGVAVGRLVNAGRQGAAQERPDLSASVPPTAGSRPLPGVPQTRTAADVPLGARTVEPTLERAGSEGMDPYTTGGMP